MRKNEKKFTLTAVSYMSRIVSRFGDDAAIGDKHSDTDGTFVQFRIIIGDKVYTSVIVPETGDDAGRICSLPYCYRQ